MREHGHTPGGLGRVRGQVLPGVILGLLGMAALGSLPTGVHAQPSSMAVGSAFLLGWSSEPDFPAPMGWAVDARWSTWNLRFERMSGDGSAIITTCGEDILPGDLCVPEAGLLSGKSMGGYLSYLMNPDPYMPFSLSGGPEAGLVFWEGRREGNLTGRVQEGDQRMFSLGLVIEGQWLPLDTFPLKVSAAGRWRYQIRMKVGGCDICNDPYEGMMLLAGELKAEVRIR